MGNQGKRMQYPNPADIFRGRHLPQAATPVGYAALIEAWDLEVPLPRRLYAIGERHQVVESEKWKLLTPRHAPAATLDGHLTFALKYEGVDLAVLTRIVHDSSTAAHQSRDACISLRDGALHRLWGSILASHL